MHRLQRGLLDLAKTKNLGNMTLREIGECVGEMHPQKIKHHLNQLRVKGLLGEKNQLRSAQGRSTKVDGALIRYIPLLGSANCGDPKNLATENLDGFLPVSPRMVPDKKRLFAIRASGSSMNRADIGGQTIDDGDYVIVDSTDRNPKNGDYVLSVIEGNANIKRFFRDTENQQVLLVSESSQELPPIYIHTKDFSGYFVGGKVIKVIKKFAIEKTGANK